LITIGYLAKTYNQLPSRVLAEATTFDIMVTDVFAAWEKFRQNPDDQTQYNADNLESILKEVRGI
jgi:hypothetical protein